MSLGKQAKVLSLTQQRAVLKYLDETRQPLRNKVMFLLSIKAGFRAKEISSLTWSMVTDAQGNLADKVSLPNNASKGKSGGEIWLNSELKLALAEYKYECGTIKGDDRIIKTERSNSTSPQVIVNTFKDWYNRLGFEGCSSHSGRRTFITNAAKKIYTVGGSMRDVQKIARHASLQMTQRYIECDSNAQRKIVDLV